MDREIRQLKFNLSGAVNTVQKLREQLTLSAQINFAELLSKYTEEVEANQRLRIEFEASKLQGSAKVMDLLVKLDASDSNIILRDAEIAELIAQIATEVEARSHLQDELAVALQTVTKLNTMLIDAGESSSITRKYEDLKESLKASQIECSKFRSELNALRDKHKSLKDTTAMLLDEVESSKSAIVKFEHYLTSNECDLIALKEKYEKLRKENESLMEAAYYSDRQKRMLESRLRSAETALEFKDSVQRLNDELGASQAQYEATVAELTAKLAAEVEANKRLHDELDASQAQYEATVAELTAKLAAEVEAKLVLVNVLNNLSSKAHLKCQVSFGWLTFDFTITCVILICFIQFSAVCLPIVYI